MELYFDYTKIPIVRISSGQKRRCWEIVDTGGNDYDEKLLKYILGILKGKDYFRHIVSIWLVLEWGVIEVMVDKTVKDIELVLYNDDDERNEITWADRRM